MANTVKKVTRKPVPKLKLTLEVCEVGRIDLSDTNTINTLHGGDQIFRFEAKEFEHCCGMIEIGGFCEEEDSKQYSNFEEQLDLLFHELIEIATRKKAGKGICIKTLVATLPSIGKEYDIVRRSFQRTGLFTLVKTFRNLSTTNQLELWVSNN